jgi:predicted RNase H-like nuclease (RuvC/YqgF family)
MEEKPEEKSMNLFKQAPASPAVPTSITSNINEILRRLRILEERYSNIRKKTQLTEQNMLDDTKNIEDELFHLSSSIKEMKKEMLEVSSKMKILNEEIEASAQKRDLDLLGKYVELWQPMTFLNRQDAERMIEDILNDIKQGRKRI